MRRHTCAIIAAVLLVTLAASCYGQELAPSYQHLKPLESMIGDWRTVYSLDGRETEGTFQAKWAPGKYCLTWVAETRAKDDGKLLTHASGVIAWDASAKRIRELAAISDGAVALAYFDLADGKIVIDRSGVLADGTKFKTRPVGVYTANRFDFEPSEWITDTGRVVQEIGAGYFERVGRPEK